MLFVRNGEKQMRMKRGPVLRDAPRAADMENIKARKAIQGPFTCSELKLQLTKVVRLPPVPCYFGSLRFGRGVHAPEAS